MVAVGDGAGVGAAVAAVVGGRGVRVGPGDVLPHPANNQRVNVKPIICRNNFLVLKTWYSPYFWLK